MIKAIIFDVDGTLVDSVDLHARAWQEAFTEFGQIGKGGDQLPPVLLSDDAEKSKPHPYSFEAAGKAGLRMIGVLCGGFTEASLREAGCIAIYRDPADLLTQYDGSLLAPRTWGRRRDACLLFARHNGLGSINIPL